LLVVDGPSRRILAPLPDGERVWLAVLCSGHIAVAAKHAAGKPIPVVQLVESQERKMIAFADIGREDLRPPIESCASESSDSACTGSFHVAVTIASERDETLIEVLFVTPDLFGSITGIDVPSTDRSDGYDGRLLP
jgi:hypothetical protein